MQTKAHYTLIVLIALAAGVATLLLQKNSTPPSFTATAHASAPQPKLMIYCAAGLKQPVERIAKQFQTEQNTEVALQYGGTATLLTQLRLASTGDLFVAADQGALDDARKTGLVQEVIPLVRQKPVLAVRSGNPLKIRKLEDLYRSDVAVAIANPEAASVGKLTRKAFGADWERFSKQVKVMKPTVTEIAADLSLGAVDAAIVWNSTVPQFKGLEAVELPEFSKFGDTVSVAVLSSSKNPKLALAQARFLAAPEKGGAVFRDGGFECIAGDPWALEPTLTLYSGGVNRLSIENLLKQFSEREGVKITTVFNGCGILCATMKTMEEKGDAIPDVYFACDLVFVPPVSHHFPDVEVLTETHIGILVKKGNPLGIKTVADLGKPGIRLGLCNIKQSTLGFMTDGILRGSGVRESVRKNVIVEVPTADFLINQMRADGLDACIVYEVNATPQLAHFEFLRIDHPGARAAQPIGISAHTQRRQLIGRLFDFFKTHHADFEKAGFAWKSQGVTIRSANIAIPEWLKASQ